MINQCRWGMSLGLRSELSSTIEQNRTCSPPRLSISCHKGKLSLPLDISRLNSVIQLHQSWLSKGVNLDSERHVAQRFLQHVMEMLPDSIWMCYWTVCHLTTRVTTSQNQRSHAVNALCILSTLSESPSVNFKKVTDVLHNYLLYIYIFVRNILQHVLLFDSFFAFLDGDRSSVSGRSRNINSWQLPCLALICCAVPTWVPVHSKSYTICCKKLFWNVTSDIIWHACSSYWDCFTGPCVMEGYTDNERNEQGYLLFSMTS